MSCEATDGKCYQTDNMNNEKGSDQASYWYGKVRSQGFMEIIMARGLIMSAYDSSPVITYDETLD